MELRILLVVAIVVAATLVGRWWQSRQGRVVVHDAPAGDGGHVVASGSTGSLTALLFTTPTCTTCPAVRDHLAVVAADRPALAVREVDAAANLDLAGRHRVRRAPTVVFVDDRGAERARVAGAVSRSALAATVDSLVAVAA